MTKQELETQIKQIIYSSEGWEFDVEKCTEDIIDLIKSLSFTDLTKIREMI